jgi:hypothetical protein
MADEKVPITIRVYRSTLEALADIAHRQGFSTISRTNISAAVDYVVEPHKQQLVDTPADYCTADQS